MSRKSTSPGQSFSSTYKPRFIADSNEWILEVPSSEVKRIQGGFYEIRLPVYASRALAIGGNILRPLRKKYREWLLAEQNGVCAICGKGPEPNNTWNLDHQPPLAEPGNKFIDYDRDTQNRVIHRLCDQAQKPKK